MEGDDDSDPPTSANRLLYLHLHAVQAQFESLMDAVLTAHAAEVSDTADRVAHLEDRCWRLSEGNGALTRQVHALVEVKGVFEERIEVLRVELEEGEERASRQAQEILKLRECILELENRGAQNAETAKSNLESLPHDGIFRPGLALGGDDVSLLARSESGGGTATGWHVTEEQLDHSSPRATKKSLPTTHLQLYTTTSSREMLSDGLDGGLIVQPAKPPSTPTSTPIILSTAEKVTEKPLETTVSLRDGLDAGLSILAVPAKPLITPPTPPVALSNVSDQPVSGKLLETTSSSREMPSSGLDGGASVRAGPPKPLITPTTSRILLSNVEQVTERSLETTASSRDGLDAGLSTMAMPPKQVTSPPTPLVILQNVEQVTEKPLETTVSLRDGLDAGLSVLAVPPKPLISPPTPPVGVAGQQATEGSLETAKSSKDTPSYELHGTSVWTVPATRPSSPTTTPFLFSNFADQQVTERPLKPTASSRDMLSDGFDSGLSVQAVSPKPLITLPTPPAILSSHTGQYVTEVPLTMTTSSREKPLNGLDGGTSVRAMLLEPLSSPTTPPAALANVSGHQVTEKPLETDTSSHDVPSYGLHGDAKDRTVPPKPLSAFTTPPVALSNVVDQKMTEGLLETTASSRDVLLSGLDGGAMVESLALKPLSARTTPPVVFANVAGHGTEMLLETSTSSLDISSDGLDGGARCLSVESEPLSSYATPLIALSNATSRDSTDEILDTATLSRGGMFGLDGGASVRRVIEEPPSTPDTSVKGSSFVATTAPGGTLPRGLDGGVAAQPVAVELSSTIPATLQLRAISNSDGQSLMEAPLDATASSRNILSDGLGGGERVRRVIEEPLITLPRDTSAGGSSFVSPTAPRGTLLRGLDGGTAVQPVAEELSSTSPAPPRAISNAASQNMADMPLDTASLSLGMLAEGLHGGATAGPVVAELPSTLPQSESVGGSLFTPHDELSRGLDGSAAVQPVEDPSSAYITPRVDLSNAEEPLGTTSVPHVVRSNGWLVRNTMDGIVTAEAPLDTAGSVGSLTTNTAAVRDAVLMEADGTTAELASNRIGPTTTGLDDIEISMAEIAPIYTPPMASDPAEREADRTATGRGKVSEHSSSLHPLRLSTLQNELDLAKDRNLCLTQELALWKTRDVGELVRERDQRISVLEDKLRLVAAVPEVLKRWEEVFLVQEREMDVLEKELVEAKWEVGRLKDVRLRESGIPLKSVFLVDGFSQTENVLLHRINTLERRMQLTPTIPEVFRNWEEVFLEQEAEMEMLEQELFEARKEMMFLVEERERDAEVARTKKFGVDGWSQTGDNIQPADSVSAESSITPLKLEEAVLSDKAIVESPADLEAPEPEPFKPLGLPQFKAFFLPSRANAEPTLSEPILESVKTHGDAEGPLNVSETRDMDTSAQAR
ncbi:hypothetical protein HDU98_008973 [Podochytrium sp. JEL0797]|nr:hypothetical protein HDU98_008973 [Podochytrium sp. JEL0797]